MSNGTPPPPPPPTNNTRNASSEQVQNQSEFYELLVKSTAKAEQLLKLAQDRNKIMRDDLSLLEQETKLSQDKLLNLQQNNDLFEKMEKSTAANTVKQAELTYHMQQQADLLNNKLIDQTEYDKKFEENMKKMIQLTDERNKIDNGDMIKAAIGDYDVLVTHMQDGVEVTEKLSQALSKNLGDEKKRRDLLEQGRGSLENFLDVQKKSSNVAEKVAKNFGLSAKFSDTMLGKGTEFALKMKQAGTAVGAEGMLGGLKAVVGQTFNLKNIFSSIVEFSAKAALEISNLSRDLGAATGYGDKFNKQITTMGAKGNMAGIGFAESATALKTLTTTLSSFNPEAAETNAHVGMTVARLSKLGVTADSAAGVMDVLQRSMGISAEAAADMTAEIATMGKEVGITTTKMMEDFKAAQGRLAAFGREGTQIFKELAAQAKATGIAMGTLTGVAKTYDTFDAAAESVGKMNAVLGTQLSTLEMIEATDSERIMMIQQQVKMSVGNFDSLDRYTKMYIAQSMGVSDVAEAQRLLNMSTAEYQKTMNGQQKSADIQKELAAATEELVPMMQQLKLVGIQIFMAFKPIITVFSGLIKVVSMILSPIGMLITFLGELVGGVGGEGQGGGLIEGMIGVLMLAGIAFQIFGRSVMTALGPVGWFALALTALFGVWHLKGSPELYAIAGESAKGYDNLASSMGAAVTAAEGTSAAMKGVHDSMHKAGGKSFNIEAMAKMDTGKIADGLTKVKSAMMELSTLKIDGFLAMSTDGAKSSIVMGSQGVIKSLSEGRLSIDVNMPEIALPPINVVVKCDDVELKKIIDARIEERPTRG
jgi:hypothetical protein